MKQRRISKPRLAGAVGALLLVGGSLAPLSPVVAQTAPIQNTGLSQNTGPSQNPAQFPNTGAIQNPAQGQTPGQFPSTGAIQGPAQSQTPGQLPTTGLLQNTGQSQTPGQFPNTDSIQDAGTGPAVAADGGFTVVLPSMRTYHQEHGGARTLGQPLSHDFQLLGRRVQIFDQQVLQQRLDGSVQPLDLLSDTLPLMHAAGATFPEPDADMVAANPDLDSPGYKQQALAAIDGGLLDWAAPDVWNDLPVNFGATFRGTVTCADLPASQTCDDRRLLSMALDVWGLPTSAPTFDPGNSDLVYLRFQRGIMQFSQSTGQTQAVPVGAWFKRILIGTDVPDDLLADVIGSRYFAQYAPSLPLGVARSAELPATSLAVAFNASTTFFTGGLAAAADSTATPVFAPALPTFGTSSSTQTTQQQPDTSATSPATTTAAATAGNTAGTPTPSPVPSGTPSPVASVTTTPAAGPNIASTSATPTTPEGPDPCAGDEQMFFAPHKPYVGTDVLVAVTSATHHDVRTVRLTGPVKTGAVNERAGLNGWVWEWTVTPTQEGWYEFTFFTDGARACATSGFNALPGFGATPVPSVTATAQTFSAATATPTATPAATPSLAATSPADPPSGACAGRLLRLNGQNFGATQPANASVLFIGPTGGPIVASNFLYWSNNAVGVVVPTGTTAGTYQLVLNTASGPSNQISYQVGTC